MKPVKLPNHNHNFGKPLGIRDDQCGGLPCYLRDGGTFETTYNVSCWEMTDVELEAVVKTRRVYLVAYGRGMIPVSLVVSDEGLIF